MYPSSAENPIDLTVEEEEQIPESNPPVQEPEINFQDKSLFNFEPVPTPEFEEQILEEFIEETPSSQNEKNNSDNVIIPIQQPRVKIVENIFPDHDAFQIDSSDFNVNNDLIILNAKELINFFMLFEPIPENLEIIQNAMRANAPKETMIKLITDWYYTKEENRSENIAEKLSDCFIPTQNNDWFFEILSDLHPEQSNFIMEKYFNNTLNPSVRISIFENITIYSLFLNNYEKTSGLGVNVGRFMTDLKKVCVRINIRKSIFLVKILDRHYQKPILEEWTLTEFKKKMQELKLGKFQSGKREKHITGWDIFNCGTNANLISYSSYCFFSLDPSVFSFFQGYDLNQVTEVNEELISPFLWHMKNIICDEDQNAYIFMLKWIAYCFQYPGKKMFTSLVIIGEQGTGKNTFTNAICKMMGIYANPCADLGKVLGKFNGIIQNKKLIVFNECQSYTTNKNFDHDKLKMMISENSIDIEKKYQNTVHAENLTNFIFISNNNAPVKIDDEKDRRFLVVKVSPKFASNKEYFNKLQSSFEEEGFYSHLFTFFMKMDVKDFGSELPPMTEAKKNIIEYSRSQFSLFIQKHLNIFKNGMPKLNAYPNYIHWCEESGYPSEKSNKFRIGILQFCDEVKPGITGNATKPECYRLRVEFYHKFGIKV